MGLGDDETVASSSPPLGDHLYPQALQLKLYQAFIFSVPILFSIILLLLFYLFYLKRRRDSTLTTSTNPSSSTLNHQPTPSLLPLHIEVDLKEELRKKLPIVTFDEDLRAKDSVCCVCLGEFEVKEKLHQIPSCRHVFHIDCIHHWLCANSTCPLCRCFIFPTPKKQVMINTTTDQAAAAAAAAETTELPV